MNDQMVYLSLIGAGSCLLGLYTYRKAVAHYCVDKYADLLWRYKEFRRGYNGDKGVDGVESIQMEPLDTITSIKIVYTETGQAAQNSEELAGQLQRVFVGSTELPHTVADLLKVCPEANLTGVNRIIFNLDSLSEHTVHIYTLCVVDPETPESLESPESPDAAEDTPHYIKEKVD